MNGILEKTGSLAELEKMIARAMQKIGVTKENALCPYLPSDEGRLHHFTLKKMKSTHPKELLELIKQNILDQDRPKVIASKPRVYGKRKKQVKLSLRRDQITEILSVLKESNNAELIEMLSSHQSLKEVQKSMIQMIRQKKADQDLWKTYVKLIQHA